ncbi:tRNA methyltransferase 1 [Quaeritorhiza haematococci]|nr:tRNA methyltransferase 1 [Quaeritorhiza haematococci]
MSSSSGDTQNGTTIIREGQAEIVFSNANEVFYNEVQEFNRDLSTAIINVWSERFLEGKRQKAELKKAAKKKEEDAREQESKDSKANEETNTGISILEALAATGLRSIRYAKEIPNAKHIVANDMEEAAVEAIKKNVAHNKVGSIVTPSQGDACFVMYKAISEKKNFDVVDLPLELLVKEGLRILLHCMQSTAARYKRYIVPLASCSIDFYVRVFVTVHTSAAEQKKAASKTGMVYHCPGCKSHVVQNIGKLVQNGNSVKYGTNPLPVDKNCSECNGRYHASFAKQTMFIPSRKPVS